MAVEFKLPEISEGVDSVDIAEWLVAEGDTIEAGQTVCEVETDKAVAEVPCPHAGTVAKIHIPSGESAAVGATLLTIDGNGSAPAPAATPAAEEPKAKPAEPTPPPTAAAVAPNPAADGPSGVVEFRLPEISEGVESVDVAEVLVKEGDSIKEGDGICEVETDKAVAEVPSPATGTISNIHVSSGQTIGVGELIATIDSVGLTTSITPTPKPPSTVGPVPPAAATKPPATSKATAATSPGGGSKISTAPKDNGKPPAAAGPATRRMARKLGVDLDLVQGSGPRGRISIEDVEAYVKGRLEGSAGTAGPTVNTGPLPDFEKFGPIERSKMNKIARTSAANLSAAWNAIPHVTQHDHADITDLEANRKRYVKTNPDKPKITMTAIMIKAVVNALKEFPSFNASIDVDAGEVILKDYYHIGVAVDTPNGLVVPVIRDCDQKGVLQVAADLTDLATRARDRKLKIDEMQGASFTITNLGGIGGTYFTPIVNWPEVAILGMSRGRKELQIGEDGDLVERMMLPLSLSYDHRVVNGADAARFIVRLSGSLSNFIELF